MANFITRFNKKNLAEKENKGQELVIAVPDIKDYLVREYERVAVLKLKNEELERKLKDAEELKLKYDAAMVTLDEYSRRLALYDSKIDNEKTNTKNVMASLVKTRDELNTYKIKFNEIAVTKEEIADEIVEKTKAALISIINEHKGVLGKKIACELISNYKNI